MPLVVPILRLVMLFVNVYESYKTLKAPPPSARNGGRPSQRALTQRKRDMKGCLAVWIVWCCFVSYERMIEALVSLFIPFYDELKSLVLLFLILTRARGAEPIFLHIIRPFLKPYTPTLDMLLDLFCMVGDILFAVAFFPVLSLMKWWRNSTFYTEEVLDSETEASQERPTTQACPSIAVLEITAVTTRESVHPQFPRKVSLDERLPGHQGRPSSERSREPSQTKHSAQEDDTGRRIPADSVSSEPHIHEIWYPPPASYSDAEDQPSDLPPSDPLDAIDEWRKYPAFPSAYPPTPIVSSSSALPSTTGASGTYYRETTNRLVLSNVLEDIPQQDFRGSLLPPRRPLNPSFVGGLSDEFSITGIHNDYVDGMSVDSDNGDEDDEDEFNITLKTPLPPAQIMMSHRGTTIPLNREVSVASSAASRSTALTTAGNASPLLTQSSSDSLSSGALSISDISSVLGRKRPLPLDSTVDVKARARMVEGQSRKSKSRAPGGAKVPLRHRNTPRTRTATRLKAPHIRNENVEEEDTVSTSNSTSDVDDDNVSGRRSANPKRRKVLMTPTRVVNPTRPIRPRVMRYSSVSKRTQQTKLSNPSAGPFRSSTCIQGRSNALIMDSAAANEASQTSSSLNDLGLAPVGRKPQTKGRLPVKAK